MNKTVVFACFAALCAVALAGGAYLIVTRPDASATFITLVTLVLGLAVTAAGTFYGFGKQGEQLDTIRQQTNGTNTELRAEVARLNKELIEALKPKPRRFPWLTTRR
jgi:hypothetical protein